MPILVALIIAVVVTVGIRQVVNRLTAAGQQRYAAAQRKLADWRTAQANRPRPAPSPLAIRTGAVIGGAVQGVVLAWDAGWPGMRLGWVLGREWVRDWWARRQEQPAPQPAAPTDTRECPRCHGALLVQDGQDVCPACIARQQVHNEEDQQQTSGQPNLRLVPDPEQGGEVSTIEAMGEINTVDDVRRAVQARIDQCVAELDDAQAEAARKKLSYDDAVALAEQAPAVLDNDPAAVAAVTGLVEPARQAWLTAQARVAHCDQQLGQAYAAMDALNQHRAMEEAAAATPQASSNTAAYRPQ